MGGNYANRRATFKENAVGFPVVNGQGELPSLLMLRFPQLLVWGAEPQLNSGGTRNISKRINSHLLTLDPLTP